MDDQDDDQQEFLQELAEQFKALYASLPEGSIKTHPTRKYSYTPVEVVITRLNSVVGDWDFEVLHQEYHCLVAFDPVDSASTGIASAWGMGECIVRGRLTLKVKGRFVMRENFGSSALTPYNQSTKDFLGFTGSPLGECYKAAAADCLKKCATMFGLALADLYPNGRILDFNPIFVNVDKDPSGPLVESADDLDFK